MKNMLNPAVSADGAVGTSELSLDFLPKFENISTGLTLGTAGMRIGMLAAHLATMAVIISL